MRSRTTESFRKSLSRLPGEIQRQAVTAYHQFARDPYHARLQFKRLRASGEMFSARINDDYRAVGLMTHDENEPVITWFFVGSHAEYNKLIP